MEKEVLHFLLGHSHIISSQLFMYLKFKMWQKKKFLLVSCSLVGSKEKDFETGLVGDSDTYNSADHLYGMVGWVAEKKKPTKQQHNSYSTPKIKLNICVGFYFSTKAHIMKNDADEFFHEFVFNKSVLILIYYFCKEKKIEW